MQNDKKRVTANNEKTNVAGSGSEQVTRAGCKNADNHDLGPWDEIPELTTGYVSEVNGRWAQEVPQFVPTRAELLAIAEHWASVAIERTFVEWANATNTDDWRRIYFAWRRVYRIREFLGGVVDRMVDDKIKKFYEETGWRKDPENWKKFLRLIDREAQKEHLAPVSDVFNPDEI